MVHDKQLLEAIADMWSQVGTGVEMMQMASRQKMVARELTLARCRALRRTETGRA